MTRIILFVSILLVAGACSNAAKDASETIKTDPVAPFSKAYGNLEFQAVRALPDGYLATGNGFQDVMLLRTDLSGNTLWKIKIRWETTAYVHDMAVASTGYMITGSFLNGGSWAAHITEKGKVDWAKSFADFEISSTTRNANDEFLFAGSTSGGLDATLTKISSAGKILSHQTLGGAGLDSVTKIHTSTDGSYLMVGGTESWGAGSSDIWVVKLSASGQIIWQKAYGTDSYEFGADITTTNNGLIVTGDLSLDIMAANLDNNGKILWQKTYVGVGVETANAVASVGSDGFIIAGETDTWAFGTGGAWIVKADNTGEIDWQLVYGGLKYNKASSIQPADQGYIIGGNINADSVQSDTPRAWLFKVDTDGQIEFNRDAGVNIQISTAGTNLINMVETNTDAILKDAQITETSLTFLEDSITDIIETHTAPSLDDIPLIVTAESPETGNIQLTWSGDVNNASGITVYKSSDNRNFERLATVTADKTGYLANGLTSGVIYYFKVRTFDESGYGSFSEIANARVL